MVVVDPGCVLYVDAEDPEQVLADLRRHYGVADRFGTLTLPGVEIRVGRNKHRLDDGAEAEFPHWPTLIEVDPPEAIDPGHPGSAGPAGPASVDGVDLVPAIVGLMQRLRRRGNRVVAACDFEDRLPRWDQLRADRVDDEDLDDGYDTGDDRHQYRGQLFTGTVVTRGKDGVWHETEIRLGLRDGLARTYRADGSLWREDWYDAGTRVRKRRWHHNGQLQLDARVLADGPQLAVRRWTEDGRPVRRSFWLRVRGKPEIDREAGWM